MDPIKFDERIFDFWNKPRNSLIMAKDKTLRGSDIHMKDYVQWSNPERLRTVEQGKSFKTRIEGKLNLVIRRK